MPLARRLYLLPLCLGATLLMAEDAPAPSPKRAARTCSPSAFGATVQVNAPLRDLKESLDGSTGFGVGLQWTREHGEFHASRTRMEFNVFPEGQPVGGVKTYAKDYLVSFDHLFRLGSGRRPYLAAGVGGVHWVLDQTAGSASDRLRTTKLAFTAGLGWQLSERVNLEGRYVFSGIRKTFDANTAQLSLGWRF